MFETEMKFQVPHGQRSTVHSALATSRARTSRLRAQYFDTPDRRLAAAGFALRLRLEDLKWVQTLKGRGHKILDRLEHEVVLGEQLETPTLDISRHKGTPAGDALAAVLGPEAASLQPTFETDVERTYRVVHSGGASVEVALDVGEIRAGAARLPLHEVEFELKEGSLADMLALAARWVERHELWLDVRSKAERGEYLLRGVEAGPPAHADSPQLTRDMHPDAALREIVRSCLAQILPNAAEIAAGVGGAEHLHQARIGLRRLRSALQVFGDWSSAVDANWESSLAKLFAQLSTRRDRDVLTASILSDLRTAGAPLTDLPPNALADVAGDAFRAPVYAKLLLALIGFAHGHVSSTVDTEHDASTDLRAFARSPIVRLQRELKKDAAAFRSLDDAKRHRTRKRLKRLRYSVEFVASLYRDKPVRRYLKRLRPAQDVLGKYIDLSVADTAFREQLEHDARAWFALGWLNARRTQMLPNAVRTLEDLNKMPKFLSKQS